MHEKANPQRPINRPAPPAFPEFACPGRAGTARAMPPHFARVPARRGPALVPQPVRTFAGACASLDPMQRRHPGIRLALAIALPACAGAAATAAAPVPPRPAPAMPADAHAYIAATEAVANYRTCNLRRGGAGTLQALEAELAAIESLARAKGLGPVLERVREEHVRMLAVSSRMFVQCAGGPEGALMGARQALAAFRSWAERMPAHRLTRAEIDAEATRAVLALDDAFAAAMTAQDAAAIGRIAETGAEVERDRGMTYAIDRLLPGEARLGLIHYATRQRNVAVDGDGATVGGIAELAYASAGMPRIGRYRYSASWRRRAGAWRMAHLRLEREAP
jgi:ketosteroid isomerase-like protein